MRSERVFLIGKRLARSEAMAGAAVRVVVLFALVAMVMADPAGDRAVLEAFKAGIVNSEVLQWTSPDPCAWNPKMIKCDNTGNVLQLRVRQQGLRGEVTPSLNNLTHLQFLELNYNYFTGAAPSLAGLAELQYAYLDDNDFTSTPENWLENLTSILELHVENNRNLNRARGGWVIPESISRAMTLTVLSVTNASVTGALPAFLGAMPALTTFEAAYNNIQGGIPESFRSSSLQVLKINNQEMNGSIAITGSIASLRVLWVHVNAFTGAVPVGLQSATGLTSLRINDNALVGPLPSGISSLPALTECLMVHNHLSGEFPSFKSSVTTNYDAGSFCNGPCSRSVTSLLAFLAKLGYPQEIATSWIGPDACASWTGVACDPVTGEVVSVILQSHGLRGEISPALANLTSLKTLILSRNEISGGVPVELVTLAALTTLDVSENNLSGPVPQFAASVKFDYQGNPLMSAAGSPTVSPPPDAVVPPAPIPVAAAASSPAPASPIPTSPTSLPASPTNSPAGAIVAAEKGTARPGSSMVPVISGVLGGTVAVFVAALLVFVLCRVRSKKRSVNEVSVFPRGESGSERDLVKVAAHCSNSSASHHATVSSYGSSSSPASNDHQNLDQQGNMFMSIDVLRSVTNNFSNENILGRGGFGVVYRGSLPDHTQIAVKRMESATLTNKGLAEFQSEIHVLTKVKHRHLVGLLGYCANGTERLLVYEYMPQGTLAQHLFEYKQLQEKPLPWVMRMSIALDVARGLEYLHNLAQRSFIHRDLKPSNILLTDDFRAKVSDFGLVKLAPEGKFSVETRLAGTFGYLAPEYAVTGRVTTKADVFSFGVVLMELITGRRALDETQSEENMHLVTWFQRLMHANKDNFRSTIDPTIDVDEDSYKSLCTVAELAGHCTSREPYSRPDMSHAVSVLAPLVEQWKPSAHQEEASGFDHHELSLPQALKQWQEYEEDTTSTHQFDDLSTRSSIPVRPVGFADSFTSTDGR